MDQNMRVNPHNPTISNTDLHGNSNQWASELCYVNDVDIERRRLLSIVRSTPGGSSAVLDGR